MNPPGKNQHRNLSIVLAIVELVLMAAIIAFDLLIPSLLVAAVGAAFVLIRKEKMPIVMPKGYGSAQFTLRMLGWAAVWSIVQFALIMPVQNHLLHDTRNVSQFAVVHGNMPNLLLFLLASWTLAAIGEEFAFRGFFQNRIIYLFRNRKAGTVLAVAVTSVFFGVIHAEQGIAGIVLTAIDSVFFSVIRYRFRSIWASVLVHGFMNSIGLITYFFIGPVYGLW